MIKLAVLNLSVNFVTILRKTNWVKKHPSGVYEKASNDCFTITSQIG